MSDMADRISVAKRLGMHPHLTGDAEFSGLTEGKHYEVVAYTDWSDYFVPTLVQWQHTNHADDLSEREQSVEAARNALEQVKTAPDGGTRLQAVREQLQQALEEEADTRYHVRQALQLVKAAEEDHR